MGYRRSSYNGKQILPREWVKDSMNISAEYSRPVIIVKTSADPDFMSKGYELKHVEFFRAVADGIS